MRKIYDILKSIAKQFSFEYPENKLLKLAAEIKKIVADKSKYTDWSTRDDIKAELKMDLILVLTEYGYPPVTNDEVFKTILEQAENFKKYNRYSQSEIKCEKSFVMLHSEASRMHPLIHTGVFRAYAIRPYK